MTRSDMIKAQLRRLSPYRGLVIDVPTWASAHNYHRSLLRLHSVGMHSPGIVFGLDVVAWNPPDNSVVVYPGMAVDVEGNIIIVSEPQRFRLQTEDSGTAYLVVQYREVAEETAPASGDEEIQPKYVVEAYALEERRQPPTEAYVELGRIEIGGDGSSITDSVNPLTPGANEIDVRHRAESTGSSRSSIAVGMVPLEEVSEGQLRHQAGVLALVRAINATTPYGASFAGAVNLGEEVRNCDLLVVSGHQSFALTEQWETVLRNFLDRGGALFTETCGEGLRRSSTPEPFQRSVMELTEKLDRRLDPVERGHPLFGSHHLFAEPPEGLNGSASLSEADGVVLSTGDYGCLWDGGRSRRASSRESIRAATELGINLAVYASQRAHERSVKMAPP